MVGSSPTGSTYYATLAHMEEQSFCNRQVLGSNPSGGSGHISPVVGCRLISCLERVRPPNALLARSSKGEQLDDIQPVQVQFLAGQPRLSSSPAKSSRLLPGMTGFESSEGHLLRPASPMVEAAESNPVGSEFESQAGYYAEVTETGKPTCLRNRCLRVRFPPSARNAQVAKW